ncbi:porin family protein [Mesonia sp.]|uniref:type IX secretion/gliding motility protein PorT/SprT n=1 Tax=Mesonia sp. TaxID=1960830 RepID=UPI00176DF8DF|nr:porin family protein [Mesonia sp.]HIB38246.1 PorT family protein [Mesonia sp.]HIO26531.1 PorT family protein [Flavobacteriaceae bacterium]
MKRLILVLTFLLGFQYTNAQLFSKEKIRNLENFDQKRWSWGYYLGFNSYDFKFDYKEHPTNDILVEKSLGFNVGLIGNLRLNDYFDLRLEPGVIFANRNLTYPDLPETDNFREVKSTYVHIPLLLKFSTKRINNFKPFIVGGLSTSFNLSSNEENPDDNSAGEFRMMKNTYYYEVGFGIDLYLFFFKFTPSIRGVFAINDELKRDVDPNSPYTGNIDQMSTRGIFINFTFQ